MSKQRKTAARATGRHSMAVGRLVVRVNGKTVVDQKPRHVEQRLVGGQWIDVKPKGTTR